MDLKNKLSEEEAIEIFKISGEPYVYIPDHIIALKEAGIIRKSAREQAREYEVDPGAWLPTVNGQRYLNPDRVKVKIDLYEQALKEAAERKEG